MYFILYQKLYIYLSIYYFNPSKATTWRTFLTDRFDACHFKICFKHSPSLHTWKLMLAVITISSKGNWSCEAAISNRKKALTLTGPQCSIIDPRLRYAPGRCMQVGSTELQQNSADNFSRRKWTVQLALTITFRSSSGPRGSAPIAVRLFGRLPTPDGLATDLNID